MMDPRMMQGPMAPRDVDAAPMEQEQLRSHDEVAYGPSDDPFARCGNCRHYQGDGTCELVEPPIQEDGVCDLFSGAS